MQGLWEFVRLPAFRLVPFLLVSVAIMAVIYEWTKPIIQQQQQQRLQQSLEFVLPLAVGDWRVERQHSSKHDFLITATKGSRYWLLCQSSGVVKGVILAVKSTQGYAADIELLIGYSAKYIERISILTHQETPGLGDQIERAKSDWIKQFFYQPLQGNDWQLATATRSGYDAISAATITSKAIVNVIAVATPLAQKLLTQAETQGICQQ